jgi:ketosteroid isomerase-like protein
MSQENVGIVRGILARWAVGDFLAGAEEVDEHVVFVVSAEFPEWGVFHGPDGIRQYLGACSSSGSDSRSRRRTSGRSAIRC